MIPIIQAELQVVPESAVKTQARLDRAMRRIKTPNVEATARGIDDRLKVLSRSPLGALSGGRIGAVGGMITDLSKVVPSLAALGAAVTVAAGIGIAAAGIQKFTSAAIASGKAAQEAAGKIAKTLGPGLTTTDVKLSRSIAEYLARVAPTVGGSTDAAITAFGGLGAVANVASRADLAAAASAVSSATSIGIEDVTNGIAQALSGGPVTGVVKEALKGRAATEANIKQALEELARNSQSLSTYTAISERWASRFASMGRRFFGPMERPLMRFMNGLERAYTALEPAISRIAAFAGAIGGSLIDDLIDIGILAGHIATKFMSLFSSLMTFDEALIRLSSFIGRIAGFGVGFLGSAGNPLAAAAGGEAGAAVGESLAKRGLAGIRDEMDKLRAELEAGRTEARKAADERRKPIRVSLDTKIQWGDSRSLQVAIEDVMTAVANHAAQRSRVSRRTLIPGGV